MPFCLIYNAKQTKVQVIMSEQNNTRDACVLETIHMF